MKVFFFFNDTATTEIYTLSLHDALPISPASRQGTAFGMLTSAQSLAMGTGPITGGVLASLTDLRMPFVASGVLLMASALLVLAVPAPPPMSDLEVAA